MLIHVEDCDDFKGVANACFRKTLCFFKQQQMSATKGTNTSAAPHPATAYTTTYVVVCVDDLALSIASVSEIAHYDYCWIAVAI